MVYPSKTPTRTQGVALTTRIRISFVAKQLLGTVITDATRETLVATSEGGHHSQNMALFDL